PAQRRAHHSGVEPLAPRSQEIAEFTLARIVQPRIIPGLNAAAQSWNDRHPPKRMTMKAAVLKAFGSPLSVETMPDPVPGTGEVIVDVAATKVLAYAGEVLSGQRNYLIDLPAIPGPGGVGRVRSIGPDATHLAVGDWVFCDPTVRSRDDAMAPDILLQGLTAGGEGGRRLQKYFRDGSWA